MDSNKLKASLPPDFRVTTRNATTRIKWTPELQPCPDCDQLVNNTRRVTFKLERSYHNGRHRGWTKKCNQCDRTNLVISPISND